MAIPKGTTVRGGVARPKKAKPKPIPPPKTFTATAGFQQGLKAAPRTSTGRVEQAPDAADRRAAARRANVRRGAPPSGGPGRKQVEAAGKEMKRISRMPVGEQVAAVQQHLQSQGFDLVDDGVWGPLSQKAWQAYVGRIGTSARHDLRRRAEKALKDPDSVTPEEKVRLFGAEGAMTLDQGWIREQVARGEAFGTRAEPIPETITEEVATVAGPGGRGGRFGDPGVTTRVVPNPALRRGTAQEQRDEELAFALNQVPGLSELLESRSPGFGQRALRGVGAAFTVGPDLAEFLKGGNPSRAGLAADLAMLPFIFAKGPVAAHQALRRGIEMAQRSRAEVVSTLTAAERRAYSRAVKNREAGRTLSERQKEVAALVDSPVGRFKYGAGLGYQETPIRDAVRARRHTKAMRVQTKGLEGEAVEVAFHSPTMGPIRITGTLKETPGRNLVVVDESGVEHRIPFQDTYGAVKAGDELPDEVAWIPTRAEAVAQRGVPSTSTKANLQIADEVLASAGEKGLPLPGRLNDRRELAATIGVVYHLAQEGAKYKEWYDDAANVVKILADHYNVDPKQVAQMVAITSSQADTIVNLGFVVKALEQRAAGKKISTGRYPERQSDEIRKVFAGEPWEGRKRNAFYMNMIERLDPDEYRRLQAELGRHPVTVDMWVVRMFAPWLETETPDQYYGAIEELVTRMAAEWGWEPKQLQAAAWVAAKTEGLLGSEIRRAAGGGRIARPTGKELERLGADHYNIGVARGTGRRDLDPGVALDEGRGNPAVRFAELDPRQPEDLDRFSAALARNPRGWSLSPAAAEKLRSARVFLSEDETTGFAIRENGEYAHLFHNKTPGVEAPASVGVEASLQAVHRGATWGNFYDIPKLQEIYEQAGFRVVARIRFDPSQVDPQALPALEAMGNPDVLFLSFGALPQAERTFEARDWDHAVDYARSLANPAKPRRGLAERPEGLPEFEISAIDSLETQGRKYMADVKQAEQLFGTLAAPVTLFEQDEIRSGTKWLAEVTAMVQKFDEALRKMGRQPGLGSGALPFGSELEEAAIRGLDEPYTPRTLVAEGGLVAHPQKVRSKVTRHTVERLADYASRNLDKQWVRDHRGVRVLTTTERAVKAAGRSQRQEMHRRQAQVAMQINEVAKVKEGSNEDIAHYWYAQLPEEYRNAEGLGLIVAKQEEELRYLASGEALRDLRDQETHIRILQAENRDAEDGSATEAMRLVGLMEQVKREKADIPIRIEDVSVSLARLGEVVEADPPVNQKLLDALAVLSDDRAQVLVASGRLSPENALAREGLVADWLGLTPDRTEIYMGHRLPRSDIGTPMQTSRTGTGRVSSPQGMSRNRLVLAESGRLRPSTRVAVEDWQQAAVFDEALTARNDLGQLGKPFRNRWLKDHVLINPKGQTIPAHWRSEELAAFGEGVEDIEETRRMAQDIVDGFLADNQASAQTMIEAAIEEGIDLTQLRLVPKRLVERYYSQYKGLGGRPGTAGRAYDAAVDAAAFSIIFFRAGYIPKNIVQNLVMALPHQGAFFPLNAARAGQVLADPELRHLVRAEIGNTANAALAEEARSSIPGRVLHSTAGFVSKFADEPARMSAFLHEAAAEGVISKVNPVLTKKDRQNLIRLLTDKRQRQRLNDIHRRSVDAMGDFSRLTPDQARMARRLLIIPGWLMAGSRYPFSFAYSHPIRSALIAYAAMGEPGAPDELRFNEPVTHYFEGHRWLTGIDTPWGRLRTSSLNPISVPWEIMVALRGSVTGRDPFDYETAVGFDYVNPILAQTIAFLEGESDPLFALKRLAPNLTFIEGMLHPEAHKNYPEDVTRWGRLKRELGVVPIEVTDEPGERVVASGGGSALRPSGRGTRSILRGGGTKKSFLRP